MVKHLNQLNFKDFGTVPPERTSDAVFSAEDMQHTAISSQQDSAPI